MTDTRHLGQARNDTRHLGQAQNDTRHLGQAQNDTRHLGQVQNDTRHPNQAQRHPELDSGSTLIILHSTQLIFYHIQIQGKAKASLVKNL